MNNLITLMIYRIYSFIVHLVVFHFQFIINHIIYSIILFFKFVILIFIYFMILKNFLNFVFKFSILLLCFLIILLNSLFTKVRRKFFDQIKIHFILLFIYIELFLY